MEFGIVGLVAIIGAGVTAGVVAAPYVAPKVDKIVTAVKSTAKIEGAA